MLKSNFGIKPHFNFQILNAEFQYSILIHFISILNFCIKFHFNFSIKFQQIILMHQQTTCYSLLVAAVSASASPVLNYSAPKVSGCPQDSPDKSDTMYPALAMTSDTTCSTTISQKQPTISSTHGLTNGRDDYKVAFVQTPSCPNRLHSYRCTLQVLPSWLAEILQMTFLR